jgi:hypothetical protein
VADPEFLVWSSGGEVIAGGRPIPLAVARDLAVALAAAAAGAEAWRRAAGWSDPDAADGPGRRSPAAFGADQAG